MRWVYPWAFALALVAMFAAGMVLYLRGEAMPAYVDRAVAMETFASAQVVDRKCASDEWYRAMEALRTERHPLMDSGRGLMLFAASGLVLLTALVLQGGTSLRTTRTPATLPTFFLLGSAATALFFFGMFRSFPIELHRHYYPWCADSIGIPMSEMGIAFIVTLPVLILTGLAVSLFFGPLPAPLTAWDRGRPLQCWAWSLACAAGAAGLMVMTIDAGRFATYLSVPSCVVGLYLLAATRAALCHRGA